MFILNIKSKKPKFQWADSNVPQTELTRSSKLIRQELVFIALLWVLYSASHLLLNFFLGGDGHILFNLPSDLSTLDRSLGQGLLLIPYDLSLFNEPLYYELRLISTIL